MARENHGRFPLLLWKCEDADTLVYLEERGQGKRPPFGALSTRLLASGSKKFAELLGPTAQFRVRRQRKLTRDGLPDKFTKFIDLSPPEEGDDAIDAIERLSCPDYVRRWISPVEGSYLEEDDGAVVAEQNVHEDLQKFQEARAVALQKKSMEVQANVPKTSESDSGAHLQDDSQSDNSWPPITDPGCVEQSSPRKRVHPPDYTVSRHQGAIERLLLMLHNFDPQISSSTMWWTVCKLAEIYSCGPAVGDYIIRWLYSGNFTFIELYPYLILDVANIIQSEQLFRQAFAIIVSNKLLGEGGRKFYDAESSTADRFLRNISFASAALKHRVEEAYSHIFSLKWLQDPKAVPTLCALRLLMEILCEMDPNFTNNFVKATKCLYQSLDNFTKNELYLSSGENATPNIFGRSMWMRFFGQKNPRNITTDYTISFLEDDKWNAERNKLRFGVESLGVYKLDQMPTDPPISQDKDVNMSGGETNLELVLGPPPAYSEMDGTVFQMPKEAHDDSHDAYAHAPCRICIGIGRTCTVCMRRCPPSSPARQKASEWLSNTNVYFLRKSAILLTPEQQSFIDTLHVQKIFHEISSYLQSVARQFTYDTAWSWTLSSEPMLLGCYTDAEWQFCPLWAGGCDDGTGGVFGDYKAPAVEKTQVEEHEGLDTDVDDTASMISSSFSVLALSDLSIERWSHIGSSSPSGSECGSVRILGSDTDDTTRSWSDFGERPYTYQSEASSDTSTEVGMNDDVGDSDFEQVDSASAPEEKHNEKQDIDANEFDESVFEEEDEWLEL